MLVYMNIFDCLRSVVSDLEIFIDLHKLNRNTRTSPPNRPTPCGLRWKLSNDYLEYKVPRTGRVNKKYTP